MGEPLPDEQDQPQARRAARPVLIVVLVVLVLLAGTWLVFHLAGPGGSGDGGDVRPTSDRGTVLLVPAPDSPVPYRWRLYRDARGATEPAAEVSKGWGPASVKPGRYYLGLRPHNIRCREVVFPEPIEAVAGQVARVDVSARIGVRPPEGFGPIHQWAVLPVDDDRPIQYAERSWQPQIVPPGRYRVSLTQRSHRSMTVVWPGTVEAKPGACAWVDLRSSIRVAPTRDGRRIDWWKIVRADDGAVVQTAYRTWSAHLVPPGRYRIAVRESHRCRSDVAFPDVIELKPDRHVQVSIDSRVALDGPDDAPPLHQWAIYPKGEAKPIQTVERAWGDTIAPPGTYEVRVVQQPEARQVTIARDVRVVSGQTAEVRIGTRLGIAQSPGLRLPYEWLVYRVGDWEPVQVARRTWEAQYLPPGRYRVAVRQSPEQTPVLFPGEVELAKGKAVTVEVGSRLRLDVPPGIAAPDRWRITHAESGKLVQVVRGTWDAQVVPPGRYRVTILASKHTGLPVAWPDAVEVKPGTEAVLAVRSGLQVTADRKWPVPKRWKIVDAREQTVQKGIEGWPVELLPPGTYGVHVEWTLGAGYRALVTGIVVKARAMTRVPGNPGTRH